MPTLEIVNKVNKKVGTVDLSDSVFGADVNHALVHQVLKAQLAAIREGTAKTKTKSEVRGGGRKPFRQKGTGNARQGSTRSPLNPGGGQSFGPIPRSYVQKTPKKMVKGAIRSVLSDRVASQRVRIIDSLALTAPKTKEMNQLVKQGLDLNASVLVVDVSNRGAEMASRNIPNLRFVCETGVNVYDLVKYEWLLMTKEAALQLDRRLSETEVSEK